MPVESPTSTAVTFGEQWGLIAGLPFSQLQALGDGGHELFIEAPTETFATLRRAQP